tara:strand:+ start:4570 stop:5292 length:723 start_codon:yes stop_codon:yes gene_type:complete
LKLVVIIAILPWSVLAGHYQHSCLNKEVIDHSYYSLCYNEKHEQSQWTEHKLNKSLISGLQTRTNNFREDPKITSGSAGSRDYRGSGYDRGHLVPAGDMKENYTSMSESFFMSNMSPQKPGFNRGIWRVLEEEIRSWVKNTELIVLTGPVLRSGLDQIKGISIPDQFYKIVYHPQSGRMIGFLLNNEYSRTPLEEFAVSVNEIEQLTGIDFFSNLPLEVQNKLESQRNYREWIEALNLSW